MPNVDEIAGVDCEEDACENEESDDRDATHAPPQRMLRDELAADEEIDQEELDDLRAEEENNPHQHDEEEENANKKKKKVRWRTTTKRMMTKATKVNKTIQQKKWKHC